MFIISSADGISCTPWAAIVSPSVRTPPACFVYCTPEACVPISRRSITPLLRLFTRLQGTVVKINLVPGKTRGDFTGRDPPGMFVFEPARLRRAHRRCQKIDFDLTQAAQTTRKE